MFFRPYIFLVSSGIALHFAARLANFCSRILNQLFSLLFDKLLFENLVNQDRVRELSVAILDRNSQKNWFPQTCMADEIELFVVHQVIGNYHVYCPCAFV